MSGNSDNFQENSAWSEGQVVQTKGYRLFLRDSGGGMPRLLFLHGLYCAASAGIPLLERMAGYSRVVAPDLPGYGRSGPFPGRAGVDEAAEGTRICLQALGMGEFDLVVGYSMGGVVAARLLALYPEITGKLALLGVPSMKRDITPVIQSLRLPVLGDAVGILASLGMKILAAGAGLAFSSGNPCRVMLQGPASSSGLVNAQLVRSAFEVDITGTAAALEGLKVLVISGDRDRIVYPEHALNWTGLLPQATLAWLPGEGHLAPFFTPGEASRRIEEFLRV